MNPEKLKGVIKNKAIRTTLAAGIVLAAVGNAAYSQKEEINDLIRSDKDRLALCFDGRIEGDFLSFGNLLPSDDPTVNQSVREELESKFHPASIAFGNVLPPSAPQSPNLVGYDEYEVGLGEYSRGDRNYDLISFNSGCFVAGENSVENGFDGYAILDDNTVLPVSGSAYPSLDSDSPAEFIIWFETPRKSIPEHESIVFKLGNKDEDGNLKAKEFRLGISHWKQRLD